MTREETVKEFMEILHRWYPNAGEQEIALRAANFANSYFHAIHSMPSKLENEVAKMLSPKTEPAKDKGLDFAGFRPCPFCGSTNLSFDEEDLSDLKSASDGQVVCKNCGFMGPQLSSTKYAPIAISRLNKIAIGKWNKDKYADAHPGQCPSCGSMHTSLNDDPLECHYVSCEDCWCIGPSATMEDVYSLLRDCWNNTMV